MVIGRLCTISIAMCCLAINSAYGQEPLSLPELLVRLTAGAYASAGSPSYQSTISSTVRAIDPALVFPNRIAHATELSAKLSRFDLVPAPSNMTEPDLRVSAAFDKLETDIEFSTRVLTEVEREELREAERLLFIGTDRTPSPDLAQFKEFEKTFDELVAQLAAETNPAAQSTIRARITQTERDWELFGRRDDIRAALLKVEALTQPDNQSLLQQWRGAVAEPNALSTQYLSSELARLSWLRVSAGSSNLLEATVSVRANSDTYELPQLSRVALDVSLLPISRPPLDSPLLLNKTWRLHSGAVLSDGNPSLDGPEELLPRVVSALVLVKNVELFFREEISDDVLDILEGSGGLFLGGIELPDTKLAPRAFQSDSVTIVGPAVIGVLVEELGKIPNPDTGREWP